MFVIRNSFVVGILYLSAIIGAGFATGREIMTFFGAFGYIGFVGLVLACLLIGFCGAKALLIVRERKIENPHELNIAIGGKHGGQIITILCGLFAYSAYVIMLAGIRQLTNESLLAVVLVSVCAYAVLYKGFDTLTNICGVLAPVSVILITILVLYGSLHMNVENIDDISYNPSVFEMLLKAILYAGYNVLTSLCVLGRCKNILNTRKNAVFGSAIGAIMLFASAGAILFGILHGKVPISGSEMPVLVLLEGKNTLLFIAILIAMLVSAITGLTGTCIFFDGIIPEKKLGAILGIIAIPLSYISFGNLMDFLYPIFGFAGIFLMIMLALSGDKNV